MSDNHSYRPWSLGWAAFIDAAIRAANCTAYVLTGTPLPPVGHLMFAAVGVYGMSALLATVVAMMRNRLFETR